MVSVMMKLSIEFSKKQECIPVGCVPPAAVAVRGGCPPGTPLGAGTPQDQTPPGPDTPCEQNHRHL